MEEHLYRSSLKAYEAKVSEYFKLISDLERPVFQSLVIDCNNLEIYQDCNYQLLIQAGIVNQYSFLYYFKISSPYNIPQMKKNMELYKGRSSMDIKFPLIQKHLDSDILYLGKCNKDFLSRIKVHLGFCSHKTYGLHLKKWFDTLNLDSNLKLDLFFAKIDSKDQFNLLEIIESSLHHHLKPLLGREGS